VCENALPANPLFAEGNGFWSVDVHGVGIGAEYKFLIGNASLPAPLWKNDPYARQMTQSNGHSVVADGNFTWDVSGYQTPAWNETAVYEVHVGTFLFDPASEAALGHKLGIGDFQCFHFSRVR
jgi:1,4-alpha-glucan branching enzyme